MTYAKRKALLAGMVVPSKSPASGIKRRSFEEAHSARNSFNKYVSILFHSQPLENSYSSKLGVCNIPYYSPESSLQDIDVVAVAYFTVTG